jgi:phosphate:Na+ symporter
MEALDAGNLPTAEKEIIYSGFNGKNYIQKYELVKQHNASIIDYCLILQRSELKEPEHQRLNQLMIALRQAMLTAKSVKDIRHNIKDYRDSANDLLHDFYKRIKKDEKVFYDSIIEILKSKNPVEIEMEDLQTESKTRHDKTLAEIFHLAETKKIADVEMATLINVFGEIHASHDSLIQSMKEIIMSEG